MLGDLKKRGGGANTLFLGPCSPQNDVSGPSGEWLMLELIVITFACAFVRSMKAGVVSFMRCHVILTGGRVIGAMSL